MTTKEKKRMDDMNVVKFNTDELNKVLIMLKDRIDRLTEEVMNFSKELQTFKGENK